MWCARLEGFSMHANVVASPRPRRSRASLPLSLAPALALERLTESCRAISSANSRPRTPLSLSLYVTGRRGDKVRHICTLNAPRRRVPSPRHPIEEAMWQRASLIIARKRMWILAIAILAGLLWWWHEPVGRFISTNQAVAITLTRKGRT
jgi:hypothetical protein